MSSQHECEPEYEQIPFSGSLSSETRSILLMGEISEETIGPVIEQMINLAELDASTPIYLVLNTPGGQFDEAIALYDLMKFVPCPVRTVAIGKVMSAGCLLFAAGQKGHRRIGANARLMFHPAKAGMFGDLWTHQNEIAEFTRVQAQFDKLIAKETSQTIEQIQALYGPGRIDRYIDAQGAVDHGFADSIIA